MTTAALVRRPNPLRLFASEWIKFWTLTSNRILAAISLLWIPANAALLIASLSQRAADPDVNKHIPSVESYSFLDTVLWLQLLIAVLAVLVATREYGSGQIKPTLLATPTRFRVPVAQAIVVMVIAFLIGVVGSIVGMLLPLLFLPAAGVTYAPEAPKLLMLAVASGAYLAGIAAVAFSIGVLVRNVVVAILVPLAFFTVIPGLMETTGNSILATVSGFFPTIAGRVVISSFENPAGLDAGMGLLTLGAWALIGVVCAGLAYRYRDA